MEPTERKGERRKLVRARPKLPEFLPDWAKCCSAYIAAVQAFGECTINLASLEIRDYPGCHYCDAPRFPQQRVWANELEAFLPLETLDLDEGVTP